MSESVSDAFYVIKLHKAGMSVRGIYERTKYTVEFIESVINTYKAETAKEEVACGLPELLTVGNQIVEVHRLFGTLLAPLLECTRNYISPQELNVLIREKPEGEDMATYLHSRLIILKPFKAPAPAQVIEESQSSSFLPWPSLREKGK